jgi:AraC-like DNA-binding protein
MLIARATFRNLCRARDLLSHELDEPLSVRDVAGQVAISPFHFIRLFEAMFGVTPHQFRIASRLERAKRLLARDQQSVTDVCMEVGFSSVGSFSYLFTRRVGATPSSYRRRYRTTIQVPAGLIPVPEPGSSCLGLMGHLPAWAFRSFREA